MMERLGFALFAVTLSGCVVHYGAAGSATAPADEATLAAAKLRYAGQAAKIDALVAQASEVDQRDRLEAAWQLAKALADNPSDPAAVSKYLDALVAIEQRAAPQNVDSQQGALDSFSPQGTKIEEETIAPADPAPH
jgi:hypothetical protein